MPDTSASDKPVTVEAVDLEILPPSLGVQFYRDGIIFLSDSKYEENISSGHVSFGTLQAYYASFKDTLGRHIIFSPKPIFQYPCDALTFSIDFGTMYYTKAVGKKPREKIFRAENFMIGETQQMWTFDPDPLPLCNDESIYSHPALSVDGSFMIFASDIDGSVGGMDLFITRNVDMRWSEPQTLGKFHNTKGNELFPVLDRNNNLYFSSDGFKGSRGYDIFICRFNGSTWDYPVRLTNSVNTKNDEFAFTIDRLTGRSAFFTSMISGKKASLQLYRINLNNNFASEHREDLSNALWGMSTPNIDSTEIWLMLKELEAEKTRNDSIEKARIETERLRAEKIKEDSLAAVKIATQKLKEDKLRAEKFRNDSIAAAEKAAQRLSAEKLKFRNDSIASARLAAQKREEERLRIEKLRTDSLASAKLAAKKMEADRLKAEKSRNDSIAAAKLAAQKLSAEKLKSRNDSIAAARLTAQKLESERKNALNKRKADSLEAERIKAENLKAEKLRIARFKADSLAAARLKENERLKKDEVYYKVQILSTVKPRGDFEVTIDGVKYQAQQYFYLKEYRYVIGAFRSVDPARELQYKARSSGWPQAFVAAFKNGERSLDKELFK